MFVNESISASIRLEGKSAFGVTETIMSPADEPGVITSFAIMIPGFVHWSVSSWLSTVARATTSLETSAW